MKKIGVIGAGISGLTTAILLQEEGFEVIIHSMQPTQQTTSAKAAAIWLPFIAEPKERVDQWSLSSYRVFEALSAYPQTGISMTSLIDLSTNDEFPAWHAAIPEGRLRKARPEELPTGYPFGFVATVPLIETPIYLQYLLDRFTNNGGQLRIEEITDLEAFSLQYPWVVNCSGLGSSRLCEDPELYPVRGQLVMVEKREDLYNCTADEKGPNSLAYIIPRKDCIILGGTSERGIDALEPDQDKTVGILARCQQLDYRIDGLKVLGTSVGIRPARTSIRCEIDSRHPVIHNYGHGGSGYTVSWGCAGEVIQFIRSLQSNK